MLQMASLVSIRSILFFTSSSCQGVVLASETMYHSLQGNNCYNMRDHGGIIVAFKYSKAEGDITLIYSTDNVLFYVLCSTH